MIKQKIEGLTIEEALKIITPIAKEQRRIYSQKWKKSNKDKVKSYQKKIL